MFHDLMLRFSTYKFHFKLANMFLTFHNFTQLVSFLSNLSIFYQTLWAVLSLRRKSLKSFSAVSHQLAVSSIYFQLTARVHFDNAMFCSQLETP